LFSGEIMKNTIFVSAISLALIGVSACETTSSRPYSVSTENVMAFQSALGDNKVQVSDFTLAEGVGENMTCRALGALEVAPGKTPVEFIEGAMRDELFTAGVYDAKNGVKIKGNIKELEFNSFGTGSWNITLQLSSDNLPEGYQVSTEYEFKTSFSAISACQNVIDAFTPAVQTLIGSVIDHPDFGKLADKARATS
ncbi:MAG: hypothetical protein AAGB16_07735, partial [Pseudomonadota bacterium]